jgi:malate dehydrogenase (oxaloacetate-decarboxylating)
MEKDVYRCSLRGQEILHNPLLNKATAFTQEERDQLGLNGLLPPHVSSLEEQLKRCRANYSRKKTALGKYTSLMGILNNNEVLFYEFVLRNVTELVPILYTPTVGEAAMQYSRIYTHQRGIYLSYPLRDQMEEMVANIPHEDVQVIVVTDGERILGLGDQGLGGVVIPIGKLALYTLFGGIHPGKTLPIVLDVGTNNPDHLGNDLYLGWRHQRVTGAEYDSFVDRFVQAIKKRYPNVLLQWEDFAKGNAGRILEKYRGQILSFNDDIQGTGAVTLAALLAAVKENKSRLSDQRIVILGAGSAGVGIANVILGALMQEGLSREEALLRLYIIDRKGLLTSQSAHADDRQRPLLHPIETLKGWKSSTPEIFSLMEVIQNAHPTVLIGVCAQSNAFTKAMIEEMQRHVERPIVFPLSNPTSKAECIPSDVIEWTKGKAILATGSPFAPVMYAGYKYEIAQCNNVYIFPGLGLGALAAEAKQVSDGMLLAASQVLAEHSPALKNPQASLFPRLEDARAIARQIAIRVAKQAIREHLSSYRIEEVEKRVDTLIWTPHYAQFVPA